MLVAMLVAQVAQVLRLPEGKVEVDRPLTSLGMDSLMGLELRNRIESVLGIQVPVTLLWTYPTVAGLARHLAADSKMDPAKVALSMVSPVPASEVAPLPELSDDELLDALRSEL
jgi:acyl carrier protein